MLSTVIIAGFTLGLFGSIHCVGMCGPLALALPSVHATKQQRVVGSMLYNCGRVITYSLLGLLFGIIGKGFNIMGFQQLFSILAGSVLLMFTILYFGYKKTWQPQWFQQFTWQIQSFIAASLKNNRGALVIGMANGLLPCGMVYAAITGALVSGSIAASALFMTGFGLATIPLMLLLMQFGSSFSLQWRMKLRKLTPFVITLVASLLILRGMNLGIPWLSPLLHFSTSSPIQCH
ncbi:MAG: sulfite exporter TauE/SafE family protein [Chitinophagaceae bacterium]|nr:sulfite exporter TauE/SafE family protein [Chitinophagaceae bacterium]